MIPGDDLVVKLQWKGIRANDPIFFLGVKCNQGILSCGKFLATTPEQTDLHVDITLKSAGHDFLIVLYCSRGFQPHGMSPWLVARLLAVPCDGAASPWQQRALTAAFIVDFAEVWFRSFVARSSFVIFCAAPLRSPPFVLSSPSAGPFVKLAYLVVQKKGGVIKQGRTHSVSTLLA